MNKRRDLLFGQIAALSDVLVLIAAFVAAHWLRDIIAGSSRIPLREITKHLWVLWLFVPPWLLSFYYFGLYDPKLYYSFRHLLKRLLSGHLIGSILILSESSLFVRPEISRLLIQIFIAISVAVLALEKLFLRFALVRRARMKGRRDLLRVLVIGSVEEASAYLRLLENNPQWGVNIVGVEPLISGKVTANGDANMAGVRLMEEWDAILQRYVVDEVVAVKPLQQAAELSCLMEACATRGIACRLLVQMPASRVGAYRVAELGDDAYFLSLETTPQGAMALAVKRLIDIIGALVGLIACGIAYLVFLGTIKPKSPGPVLFKQKRGGLNGRIFTAYKFRTMVPDAEERREELLARNDMRGAIFKMKDDPRVIPAGRVLRRFHIDELPQCWNVLRGDMSLVGPRPCPASEVAQYRSDQRRRLSIKPGITGVWQLSGNGHINDLEEIVRLDCEYIDNWSLWLDLRIIAQTIAKIPRGEGW